MAAQRKHAIEDVNAPVAGDRQRFLEGVEDLYMEIATGVSGQKVEATMRQWLAKTPPDDDTAFARAMVLAMDLEVFTPSLQGSTPIDRLGRKRLLSADEAAKLAVLKSARLAVLRIVSVDPEAGSVFVHRLVGDDRVTIWDHSIPAHATGVVILTRLYVASDGGFGVIGPITPLDDAGLEVAMGFVRPGKGGLHDQRCAAAVYRHVARHGNPQIEGINQHSELDEDLGDGPDYEPTPIDLFAKALIADIEPPRMEEVLDEVRMRASVDGVIEAVFKWHGMSHVAAVRKMAEAYRRVAEVMIETLHNRALSGVGLVRSPFEAIERAIDHEIATAGYPKAAKAFFIELRDLELAKAPAKTSSRRDDDELGKVIERIRALRAKTLDQGCTESEALAAATKVAELLDRYGLTLDAVEIERQACEGFGIETDRKRTVPLDECLQAISAFCDCKAWQEKTAAETLRSIFFGLPADVEAARYLYERVAAAFDTETAAFKRGALYAEADSGGRRTASNSFQVGLASGISRKLLEQKAARDDASQSRSGRDLVPLKKAAIADDLSKLGLTFTSKERSGRRVQIDAFREGEVAGRKFEARSGLR